MARKPSAPRSRSIPPEQAANVSTTYRALKPFRALRETMPLQYVTAFLAVAMDEGKNTTEYAKRVGTSQSLMSRHLADLGEVNRYHEPGFGLVEQYYDLNDRRNKLIRLTDKGRSLVWELCEAFQN